jgi:predicted RNA-binding protein (virulence factor B family)
MALICNWEYRKMFFYTKVKFRNIAEPGDIKVVKLILDYDGRLAATELIESWLDNSELTVIEKEQVSIIIIRETDLGYNVAINNKHLGLLHYSDVFRHVKPGDVFTGHIKRILPENKLDVAEGKHGYQRVEDELGENFATVRRKRWLFTISRQKRSRRYLCLLCHE